MPLKCPFLDIEITYFMKLFMGLKPLLDKNQNLGLGFCKCVNTIAPLILSRQFFQDKDFSL